MTRAHDATDTAITQATVHLVARLQDPTVGAVAQATGVARGTVYRYLPTRQALLSTVLDQGLGKAERHLSQANLTAVPVAESLTRAVRALVAQGRLSWCSLISGCLLEGAPPSFSPVVALLGSRTPGAILGSDLPLSCQVEALHPAGPGLPTRASRRL